MYVYIYKYMYIYIIQRERDTTSLRGRNTWKTLEAFGTTKCFESLHKYIATAIALSLIAMVHTISDIKLKLAKCDVAVTVKTDKILFTFKDSNVRTTKSTGEVNETNDALGREAKHNLPKKLSEMSLMELASVPVKIVQPTCSKKHPPLSKRQIMHGWWRR